MPISYYPVPVPAGGGGGTTIIVQEDDVTVDAAVGTIDFRNGLDVTSSPAGEANVSVDLAEYTGAALPVAGGGTGAATFTDGGVLVGNGTAAIAVTAVGTAGHVLTSNGAGLDPTFQAAPGGSIIVQEDDVTVDAAATTIDFGNGLDVTSLPAGEANVVVDLGEYTGAALPVTGGGTGAITAAAARTNLGAQTADADLDALAALATNGLVARTGAATYSTRTITGTSPVTVTDGDGVAGNPTISLSPTTGTGSVVLGTSPTISTPTLTLKQSTAPAPTAEGDIQWDTDDNRIAIGDGVATKVFSDDTFVLARANHTGTQLASTISDFNEAAQDAVGGITTDTSTIDFTYDDVGNTISAIVVAGSINTTQLADNSVSFAKMADLATDRLIGRDAAGSGDPEALTVSGGIEFTGTGGIQTSAFTGDVTKTAGGTATTIATDAVTTTKILNSAVTYAKIQNVSLTDRLLGRDTAGAGVIEELTAGGGIEFTGTGIQTSAFTGDVTKTAGGTALTIANDAVTNAKMANAAIGIAELSAIGTPSSTTFLRGDNTWATPAGGGGSDTATTRVAKLRQFA